MKWKERQFVFFQARQMWRNSVDSRDRPKAAKLSLDLGKKEGTEWCKK
jgi:hypothetical protein